MFNSYRWSFGILLWEIMSLGKKALQSSNFEFLDDCVVFVLLGRSPYPGKSAEEMVKCIGEGYRMPSPDGCPQEV